MIPIVEICARTEKGLVRHTNEDHILIGRLLKNRGTMSMRVQGDDDYLDAYGLLLAVADGIGGQAGGNTASRVALHALDQQFYSDNKSSSPVELCEQSIASAITCANQSVLKLAEQHPEFRDMGCTLAGVCLFSGGWMLFNVGDSRVYRHRKGHLRPLTRDDSLAAHAVEVGLLSVDEAQKSKGRHTVTNCIGSTTCHFQLQHGPALRAGDDLLICSDGLHDLLPIDEMETILMSEQDTSKTVDCLVQRALEAGGHDNISVIVVRFCSINEPSAENLKTGVYPGSCPDEQN